MMKGASRPRSTCKGNAMSCHVPCPRATHEGGGDVVPCVSVRKAVGGDIVSHAREGAKGKGG
jgi:hypothetical protein